jgi:adenosylhomocysteine nucleosidase
MKNFIFMFCLFTSFPAFSKNILIISAMNSEKEKVVKELNLKGPTEFPCGKIGKNTICSSLVGVGKVNAAMNTQALITKFKPDQIIFSGIAGAVNPNLKVGDVVIGKSFFQHDFGFQGDDGIVTHRPGMIPELGNDNPAEDIYIYQLDHQKNFAKFYEVAQKATSKLQKIGTTQGERSPTILLGSIATGDQFIASKKRKDELLKLSADAVEMEGAATCYVAVKNKTECYIIRSISDSAQGDAIKDYPAFFNSAAVNAVILIKEYLSAI